MLSRIANGAVEGTFGTSLFAAVISVFIVIHALSVPVMEMEMDGDGDGDGRGGGGGGGGGLNEPP